MNTPMPSGLSRETLTAAMPLRDLLVDDGWIFGAIHWDNEYRKTLNFTATAPSGASVYIFCDESALARRLQLLLDNKTSRT